MCVGNKECIRLQSDRFIAEALITVMDVSNGRRSILPGDAEGWALHEDSPLEGCLPPPPNPESSFPSGDVASTQLLSSQPHSTSNVHDVLSMLPKWTL